MWYRGLQLKSNADRNKIDAVAKTLLIGPQGDKFTDVSFTVDLTVNGAGGLDVGSEVINQWYDLVAVLKRRGGLARIDGMFVKSGDTPVFPPRYSAFDRLSSHRNNGSGDLYRFTNAGDSNWFFYNENVGAGDFLVLSNGISTVYVDVNTGAVIPPTSRYGNGHVHYRKTTATDIGIHVAWRSNDMGNRTAIGTEIFAGNQGNLQNVRWRVPVFYNVDSSQIFEYSMVGNGEASFAVHGYEDIR